MACFDTDKLILRHYPSNLICNKSTSRVAPATLVASKKSFVHCWKKEVSPRQPCECQPISAASSSRSGLVYPRQLTPPLFAYQNQTLSGIGSRICRQLDVNHFYQLLVLVIGVPSRRRSSTVRQRPRFYLGYVLALLKKKKKKGNLLNLKSAPLERYLRSSIIQNPVQERFSLKMRVQRVYLWLKIAVLKEMSNVLGNTYRDHSESF